MSTGTITSLKLDSPKASHRDAIYWTELEFRRLNNLVAQILEHRQWIGDGPLADRERSKLRRLIDGMRRKALRILHRAEVFMKGDGHGGWPGLDSSVNDPVFMAEAYVRAVEEYENVFGEEEQRAKKLMREESRKEVEEREEDEKEERMGGREREKEEATEKEDMWERGMEKERENLLESVGLRKRKGNDDTEIDEAKRSETDNSTAQEDEELMSKHRSDWDENIAETLSLVGSLKRRTKAIGETLEKDSEVVDDIDKALDGNLDGASKHRADLEKYTKRSSRSTCFAITVFFMCLASLGAFLVITRLLYFI